MAKPIEIAVVGHTNAGKTSLLRTLKRRSSFGEVSERPGTTRHVEAIDLNAGRAVVRFYDTPGLEDPVGLLEALGPLRPDRTPPQRIRDFLKTPAAGAVFEQEAKVLRALLDVDAALYVVDCREPVVPKFRCEIEILASCGVPVLPVLNFVRDEARREADWQKLLSDFALHALARFDAVAPFAGSEQRLYRDLQTLIPARDADLAEVAHFLEQEKLLRRESSWRVIAGTLVHVAAARVTLSREEVDDAQRRSSIVRSFREGIRQRVRGAVDELLAIHAFSSDEADVAVLPWLDGRWERDLFDSEVLRDASVKLGIGAAVGASIGLAADVAMAGLSLGTGAAIGAAIGSAASQGFGAMGRRVQNWVMGRQDLTLEDAVLLVIASRLVSLLALLEVRGHAALRKVVVDEPFDRTARENLKPMLELLARARGHPEWAQGSSAARDKATVRLMDALRVASGPFLDASR